MGKAARTSRKYKKAGQQVVRTVTATPAAVAAKSRKDKAEAAQLTIGDHDDAPNAGKSSHAKKRTQRGSRNKKKNAKKIDLADVDAGLESLRHDERTGGAKSDKADADLFFTDTTPRAADGAPMSRKERARSKTLHLTTALAGNQHTKPQNPPKKLANKVPGHMEPALFRESKRKRLNPPLDPQEAPEPVAPQGREVWDAVARVPTTVDLNPWLEPAKARQRFQKKRPETMLQGAMESTIPAVEPAPAGASYNPSFAAHQELLEVAHTKAAKIEEQKIALDKKLPKSEFTAKEQDAIAFKEYSAGLGLDDDSDDSDSESEEDKALELAPVVMPVTTNNRKTQQKRKRIAKQKLRDVKAKERKLAKQREQEFFRLRSLKREVRETEAEFAQRQVDRKAAAQAALAKPRQFGSIKYTEPKVAVKLTDELTDSLRNLKPEDNLFKDRFHSMQKRNMIEVRKPTKLRRRYKLKEYEKRSYKNYDLQRQLKKAAENKESPNTVAFLEGLKSKSEGKGANLVPIDKVVEKTTKNGVVGRHSGAVQRF